jgi:peroxiredoxin
MDPLIKNGSPAPEVTITDLEGRQHTLAEYAGKVTVLIFWSAECHWSKRADEALLPMRTNWGEDVAILWIAPNANETRQDIEAAASSRKIAPVILDQDQTLARTFGASITPEAYVFDRAGILRYQGGFDDANFRNPEPTRNYLWEAVQSILAGEHPTPASTKAYGCTIVFNTEE